MKKKEENKSKEKEHKTMPFDELLRKTIGFKPRKTKNKKNI